MIVEDAVDCITFDEVLNALQREQIDVLQIDTEGADARVLSPSFIGRSNTSGRLIAKRLARFGYRFAPSGDEDMLAVIDNESRIEDSPE